MQRLKVTGESTVRIPPPALSTFVNSRSEHEESHSISDVGMVQYVILRRKTYTPWTIGIASHPDEGRAGAPDPVIYRLRQTRRNSRCHNMSLYPPSSIFIPSPDLCTLGLYLLYGCISCFREAFYRQSRTEPSMKSCTWSELSGG